MTKFEFCTVYRDSLLILIVSKVIVVGKGASFTDVHRAQVFDLLHGWPAEGPHRLKRLVTDHMNFD